MENLEALSQRLNNLEGNHGKLWDTLDKLLTAVNEIKISLTHLEVLSKKDAEQDDKINRLKEDINKVESKFSDLKLDLYDSIRGMESELKVWRFGVITAVVVLTFFVTGNLELIKSIFL